jgi:hypothetical protein
MANQAQPYTQPLKMPVWRGESLIGKTITIQAEQGFGDIIQYARFLPFLKVMGAKSVVLLQHGSLHNLFDQLDCVDTFTNMPEEGIATESDYWLGIISLPYYISLAPAYAKALFPLTTKKIVGSEGYLDAIPSNIPKKLAVNWATSKGLLHYVRTMHPEKMLEIVGDDAYSFNPQEDRFWTPLPNDGWKEDWFKTASHLKACKGLVTVDTGIAHLAGALGVKTVVIMPKKEFKCWRWKHGTWYDSVVTVEEDELDKIPDLIRRM